MSETDSIQVAVDNETENYAVYESADEDTIVGMYVSEGAAEQIGEFGEVTVSTSAEVEAGLNKTTTNYGVYETAGGAISGMYISHDLLEQLTDSDEYEQDDAPESVGLTIAPSTESAFEDAQGVDEDEEEALVVGGADSDDSDEAEVEISDEEVGLVEE